MPPGFQELPEDLKREARERVETLLANASALRARLRNAGGGTALNIRAVLMLRPHDPKVLPKQFSAFEALPIAPGDSREIEMGEGGRCSARMTAWAEFRWAYRRLRALET
jgi:hypothetical protein